MKKQLENDQIIKLIEREQVISYKKRNDPKGSYKPSKQDQQEVESAHSLKSNVFSDDTVKFYKKNVPLPQLGKDRKKIFGKISNPSESKHIVGAAYLQKQVRQQDNLLLKQQNNHLTTENMKLKTKLMTLQKENIRLQKMIEEDPLRIKHQQNTNSQVVTKDFRILKPTQASSIKLIVKNLKKQLEDIKNQNHKIKSSVKFTRINQLECERDTILQETLRLRQMLDEEISRRANIKIKQYGVSTLESRVNSLQDKNATLIKENLDLQNKLKKAEESNQKVQRFSENQKNLNKMLFNARRLIRDKQKQLQNIKASMQEIPQNVPYSANSLNQVPQQNSEENPIKTLKEVKQPRTIIPKRMNSKQKRIVSKSAQKNRSSNPKNVVDDCQNCKKMREQIKLLQKKIEDLNDNFGDKITQKNIGQIRKGPIQKPTKDEIDNLSKFLTYRFKAHHLTLPQAEKYLIHNENLPITNEEITIAEIVQSSIAEPFSILSSRYLETFITYLFYPNSTAEKITLDEKAKLKKSQILKNFKNIIKEYDLMDQSREEEMFIQIAELVTNYHQHILTALNGKRNGEGTISQTDITAFFQEIELEKEYVDFIITQIILESYDLGHLNYYAMFEIFYMPAQDLAPEQPKNKFHVEHIVKEEDEEYEESRSYIDSKQKTMQKREDDNSDVSSPNKKEQNDYEQLFEQQKVERAFEQQKPKNDHKPYVMQQQLNEYEQEYDAEQ